MILLSLLACSTDPVDTSTPADSGTPVDTDTDTATPADDTADPDAPVISAVSGQLHDSFGSVVVVSWEQSVAADAWVAFSFDGGDERTSPVVAREAGSQEALVLGVPFEADVTWRVVYDTGDGPVDGKAQTTTTDDFPDGLPVPTVLIADPTGWDADAEWIFMSITEGTGGIGAIYSDWWVFVMDREGRIVWARQTPSDATSLHPRISHDGTSLLIEHGTFWGGGFDFGANSKVYRMKIDGTIEHTYDTPGLHHPFTDTADGSLVWAANETTNETLQQVTLDGTQTELWDCKAHLHSVGLTGDCGSNSIYWHESEDTFLYSFYSLFTMFEITREGDVIRTFGQLDTSWSFDPVEANFWWQHGGYYTDEGTLLVSTYVEEAGVDTIMREYTLDEGTQTLTEVWNFGIGDGLYGQYMGEPHRLHNGNSLHNTGSLARLRETTPEGEVVWDVDWVSGSSSPWIGRSTPVSDLYDLAP